MGHDDWQRLLLSNSTSIRLHLFLSYCVCLPLNLTRQRLSILRGARARVQSRSEDESERWPQQLVSNKTFYTLKRERWSNPVDMMTAWCWFLLLFFSLWLLSCSFYLFLFELKEFLKLIFFLFFSSFSKYENKFDHLCVSLVVDCRFFLFFSISSSPPPPFSWKLRRRRRRRKKQIGIRPFEVLWSLTVSPWEEESHSTHKTRNTNKI